jgi:hypothetical protein
VQHIEPAVLELALWLDRWLDRDDLSDLHEGVRNAWLEHLSETYDLSDAEPDC